MHEASLMRNLMRQIGAAAAAEGATRIVGVRVRLGAFSHFSPAHFAEHFKNAATGTIADGARLMVTASEDAGDPRAGEVVLESVDVAD